MPLIFWIAGALNEAGGLESLEQWRQHAGFKRKLVCDAANRLTVLPPEDIQDKILRIGQTQRIEQRLIVLRFVPVETKPYMKAVAATKPKKPRAPHLGLQL